MEPENPAASRTSNTGCQQDPYRNFLGQLLLQKTIGATYGLIVHDFKTRKSFLAVPFIFLSHTQLCSELLPDCIQGSLLVVHVNSSEILELEPRWAVYKASALPNILLLQPTVCFIVPPDWKRISAQCLGYLEYKASIPPFQGNLMLL